MASKPRVAYLDHVAQLSGAELALLRLLPSVEDVDPLVILAEDGPLRERFEAEGIACEVLPINPRTGQLRKDRVRAGLPIRSVWDTLTYANRLAKRLREIDADLVHTNSLKAGLYGGLAARIAGVPQVWHVRDRIAEDYLPAPAVRLVRFAVQNLPAAVIANSTATLETLTFRKGPRRVLPSPVVMNDPVWHPENLDRWHDGFLVGVVGRLAPWKGQDVFLRAFAQAFPDGEQRALIVGSAMFGEQAYADSLVDLAQELGIAARVRFAGFVTDVPSQLAAMDILVHCSIVPEPFGQVVIEGMAAGLPVVAADAGGPAEIIDAGRTGLLTPPGDVTALADALRQLAGNDAWREELGNAAKAAIGRYAPDIIGHQLRDIYNEVLSSTRVVDGRRRRTRLRRLRSGRR